MPLGRGGQKAPLAVPGPHLISATEIELSSIVGASTVIKRRGKTTSVFSFMDSGLVFVSLYLQPV